jgi:hypothetical protein
VQVPEQGGLVGGELAELEHGRLELGEEVIEQVEVVRQVVGPLC